jgi:hypothetical protein
MSRGKYLSLEEMLGRATQTLQFTLRGKMPLNGTSAHLHTRLTAPNFDGLPEHIAIASQSLSPRDQSGTVSGLVPPFRKLI